MMAKINVSRCSARGSAVHTEASSQHRTPGLLQEDTFRFSHTGMLDCKRSALPSEFIGSSILAHMKIFLGK